MKTPNLFLSIFLFGLLSISSCSDSQNEVVEPKLTEVDFDFGIREGTLTFPTETDFQSAIDHLVRNNTKKFTNYTFTSYLDVNKDTDIDNVFAALISNEQKIIIGDYEFFVDFDNEVVEAKSVGRSNAGRISHYSFNFDDNAFAIIEGEQKSSSTVSLRS